MTYSKYTSQTENVGQFRCETSYHPAGKKFSTDLSAEYAGLAEYPSPGIMLGATLASCMISLLSVVASRKGVDLKGMRMLARPVENDQGIAKIELKAIMPLAADHPLRPMLEKTALACPVHRALNPALETPIEWEWR